MPSATNHPAQNTFCRLTRFSTLRVSGADAESYLQNLLSNDIREVSATQAQFSSFNSAKGRMLASFLIWRDGDDYLLQLPASLGEALRRKLGMYVLRAKVSISDAGMAAFGLFGSETGEVLRELGAALPQQPLGVGSYPPARIIRVDGNRFMLVGAADAAGTIADMLGKLSQPADDQIWDWLNIRAGIPVILPQTQEQFVPQMVNFDLIGGINFKKGCYPGQEIVARMHYLGKLKRRMYLAHLDDGVAPEAGDELFSEEMQGQACGMIANAAPAPDGGYDVLAVVQIASRDGYTVHLRSLQGAQLQFKPLPYPLP